MFLLLYINDKLIDAEPLNLAYLNNDGERQTYIRGAMNHLLEKWSDVLEEQAVEPRFVIKIEGEEP